MNPSTQRQVFLDGEGDAWFHRNLLQSSEEFELWRAREPLGGLLADLPLAVGEGVSVLEVGCGQGLRLEHLRNEKGWHVAGLDPSEAAVKAARALGLEAHVATADVLPVASQSVDLLIYGFCLYLCDRSDLFQIAAEAHRVLKSSSWLAIVDFWSPYPLCNPYHHKSGIYSHKADLPAMFSWHPSYVITDHRLRHHADRSHTDDPNEWVAATILRRCDGAPSPPHD